MTADTIAAIATATGGGVGIVRISGPRAELVLRALCPALPRNLPSHKLVLTEARNHEVLDQVLAVVMRAPRSYTGEDVAELHAHGGAANLRRLLDATLAAGARLATPGEFTRRAFVAGKLDLTQAEAVQALVGARDERTLRAAHALRSGTLGRAIEAARRAVVAELAEIEGALDFPDEAADELKTPTRRAARLHALANELSAHAAHHRRPLGVVPEIILMGPVNAGKSSLLNALCGHERALVDSQPGTTRDVVEADVDLGPRAGVVRLVDTAGLRDGLTALEQRGQAIAHERRKRATLTVLVYDAQRGYSDEDEALRSVLVLDGAVLVVENKSDLSSTRSYPEALAVSAQTGAGLDTLRARIADLLGNGDEEVVVASARQAEALRAAASAIDRGCEALAGLAGPSAPELAAVDLRHALGQLGQLTGETVDEEVLDALFARFCIGK
ncbi:MAG: tRNA uridine-5-carboxymethylaminomethyl(34) synthesis GTPase MnmE [Polyangia bacterium]